MNALQRTDFYEIESPLCGITHTNAYSDVYVLKKGGRTGVSLRDLLTLTRDIIIMDDQNNSVEFYNPKGKLIKKMTYKWPIPTTVGGKVLLSKQKSYMDAGGQFLGGYAQTIAEFIRDELATKNPFTVPVGPGYVNLGGALDCGFLAVMKFARVSTGALQLFLGCRADAVILPAPTAPLSAPASPAIPTVAAAPMQTAPLMAVHTTGGVCASTPFMTGVTSFAEDSAAFPSGAQRDIYTHETGNLYVPSNELQAPDDFMGAYEQWAPCTYPQVVGPHPHPHHAASVSHTSQTPPATAVCSPPTRLSEMTFSAPPSSITPWRTISDEASASPAPPPTSDQGSNPMLLAPSPPYLPASRDSLNLCPPPIFSPFPSQASSPQSSYIHSQASGQWPAATFSSSSSLSGPSSSPSHAHHQMIDQVKQEFYSPQFSSELLPSSPIFPTSITSPILRRRSPSAFSAARHEWYHYHSQHGREEVLQADLSPLHGDIGSYGEPMTNTSSGSSNGNAVARQAMGCQYAQRERYSPAYDDPADYRSYHLSPTSTAIRSPGPQQITGAHLGGNANGSACTHDSVAGHPTTSLPQLSLDVHTAPRGSSSTFRDARYELRGEDAVRYNIGFP